MKTRAWMLAVLGLAAFGVLVWFGAPLLSIGDTAPLAGSAARIALIVLFVLQYLAQKAWAAWRAARRNEQVAAQLAPAAPAAESAELAQLRKRFDSAVAALKRTRFGARGGAWSSLSWKFGRQYLYQLPWYAIIGAPGAGKTTALLNSGLQFPLAGEFGRSSIKGVGGTRNCDWWFTDSAVLLDTAGRYTTHESDRMADRQAWQGFLALLKRTRPRRPLNGALVAVSATDLLAFDPAQRAAHAAMLGARLDELRAAIGIRVPVYLLVTKCDLLPGFLDSFLALDRHDRDQIWGATFDYAQSDAGHAAALCAGELEQLQRRLHEGLVERMQAERDPQRRARIFAFPRQFAALTAPLDDLVQRAFGVAPAPGAESVCLRGVYFTSGTQEGTPIDRTLSALGRELGLERQILPPNQSTGRSFFLAGLLRDVVFAEAELAGRSARLERWRTRALVALLAAVQVGGVLLAADWLTAYARSSDDVARSASDTEEVRAKIAATDTRPGSDPRALLPALNALRELAASAPTSAPLSRFAGGGLGVRAKLASAALQAYQRMLGEALLPRIVERCEEQMRSGADANLQYEALKAYAMLREPSHFDAASLKQFVTYEWDTSLEALSAGDRAQLAKHLDTLVEEGAAGGATVLDPKLGESVRARLAGQPMAQRVLTRLEATLAARPYPEFTTARLGAGGELFVSKDGYSVPRGVPGRYTLEAYRDGVAATLPAVGTQLAAESSWVLGTSASAGSAPEQAQRASAEALAAYLDRYARSWSDFLADLRLKRADTPAAAQRQARRLSEADGPVATLARAVVEQTRLTGVSGTADAVASEQAVESRFAPWRALLEGGNGASPPIDAALADFKGLEALRALIAPGAAIGEGRSTALAQVERIRADSVRYPEPVHSMLLQLAAAPPAPPAEAGIKLASAGQSLPEIRTAAASSCAQLVPGRFPFDRGSTREISMADFNRLFGPSAAGAGEGPAARVRDVFFAGKRPEASLRLVFRPHDMDETIDRLVLEIDGQAVRYAHGPVTATTVMWPGPAPGARVAIEPAGEGQSSLEFSGTWALFRLFDKAAVESVEPGRFRVVFNLGGRRASFDVETESGADPFRLSELERFECPAS